VCRVAHLRRLGVIIALVLVSGGCDRAHVSVTAVRGPFHLPRLDHVVVVVFENKERSTVVGQSEAPTFNRYAHAYAYIPDYNALSHPSLPNYLALVSGSTQGIQNDCTDCGPWTHSLGGQLTEANKSWGGYAEGYPDSPRFAKRHMPFLYFNDGVDHVHPLTALDPHHLPAFAFVAPDLCHDGHDCPLSAADAFLRGWLPPYLSVPRTAVFVLFDEGTTSAEGGGLVYALVAGTAVKRHFVAHDEVDHYAILRTIEDIFRLPALGIARDRKPVTTIWRAR
jgi:hypothetical protein